MKPIKQWKKLSKEIVKIFKDQLEKAQSNLI